MPDITITAQDGGTFDAYIALPAVTPAPVVILIQEIFGVNQEMRTKCNQMAEAGYIAVCPDLFWRIEPGIQLSDQVPAELERAFDLFGQFDVNSGVSDLQATLQAARSLEGSNGRVGAVGYCLGGKLAYMMSVQTDVNASVGYYGVGIEGMLDEAADINTPLLLHIAEKDEFVPPPAQAQILEGLSDNAHITMHTYPGVDHAFARIDGMHYDEAAAVRANARTAEFLEMHLKSA